MNVPISGSKGIGIPTFGFCPKEKIILLVVTYRPYLVPGIDDAVTTSRAFHLLEKKVDTLYKTKGLTPKPNPNQNPKWLTYG